MAFDIYVRVSGRGEFWAPKAVEIPSVCKSNRVVLFAHPPVFSYQIGVYSINSSKMLGNVPGEPAISYR